jgi:hypothetical protein
MLYLCNLSGEAIAPSDIVDYAWHEMMLFTRWYQEFCLCIGGFIHHDPTPPEEKEEFAKEAKEKGLTETPTYTITKRNYKKFFKEDPDPRYWP